MPTRSTIWATIAVEHEDGQITCVYCHHDGYYEGVGKTLLNHYNTLEQVEALIALGNIFVLDTSIDCPAGHSFNSRIDRYTVFYGRDRGEENQHGKLYDGGFDEYVEAFGECGEDYSYLFRDGQWEVFDHGKHQILKEVVDINSF